MTPLARNALLLPAWAPLLGGPLLGATPSPGVVPEFQEPAAKAAAADPTPERIAEAWSFLTEAEQTDAEAYLREATRHLETFQQGLIDFARSLDPRDLGAFPEFGETPFYDPAKHAPGQPIARKRLEEKDARAARQRAAMLRAVPNTGHEHAWRYDWASGEVQRAASWRDPRRVVFNALAGFPPDADLAQAMIERALDDGRMRTRHAAFAHAYTDRSGNVFPGLTLYDAWSSGVEMEMPDVDVLGVIHDLANDWKSWVAPVPDTQHDDLYAKVFGYFQEAKRHRGLRTALAMTFANGGIALRDGYSGHRDRLHSFWDEHSSTPAQIAPLLPEPAQWSEYLESWSARIDGDAEATRRGLVRRATLDADGARVRATALAILDELGAFRRKSRPAPPAPPAPAPPKQG